MLRALLGVAFRSTNYSLILNSLNFLRSCEKDISVESSQQVTELLLKSSDQLLRSIFEMPRQPALQYMRNMADLGGFAILKKLHFQKQNYFYNTMTTDGRYLYLYISCSNGGMFKIGTGEGNTCAGKIYLHVPINSSNPSAKIEEVSWVYLRGKLYLRTSGK